MNWELFGTAFGMVFLAELGDKTQIAALSLSATNRDRVTVFVAASLALVLATAIGVGVGGVIGHWAESPWVQRVAGLLFVAMGVWYVVAAGWPGR